MAPDTTWHVAALISPDFDERDVCALITEAKLPQAYVGPTPMSDDKSAAIIFRRSRFIILDGFVTVDDRLDVGKTEGLGPFITISKRVYNSGQPWNNFIGDVFIKAGWIKV